MSLAQESGVALQEDQASAAHQEDPACPEHLEDLLTSLPLLVVLLMEYLVDLRQRLPRNLTKECKIFPSETLTHHSSTDMTQHPYIMLVHKTTRSKSSTAPTPSPIASS